MISKKKRDEIAETEKEMLLNPRKLREKQKRKKRKLVLTVICELAAIALIVCSAFQIVRAVGKNSLLRCFCSCSS